MNSLEVCFSPALFPYRTTGDDCIVVIVDILRATTAMCTAFYNGVKKIIPVATIEEAKECQQNGFLVAVERGGVKPDFADFGNSPIGFFPTLVKGKTIVYSTTNGTQAINTAMGCKTVVLGAFANISKLSNWLSGKNENIIILCSGWKNTFSLEDSVFAGALITRLLEKSGYTIANDAAFASLDLWNAAKENVDEYLKKASHRQRLQKLGLENEMNYCFSADTAPVIPALNSVGILMLIQ